MTSIIRVEPFSGVYGSSPPCYLLTVDDVRILLDCGWNESFSMDYINELKPHIPRINAVLLSYGDVYHCGALPYLVGKLGLKCPIYSTVPVLKSGQLALYDWVQGHLSHEDFDLFNYDDIDNAFDRIEQLKYNQTALLRGDNGLQITALPAGHMLGGAIWRITKMGDEEIIYAIDFNHKKERHLNGCTFDGVGRPALMITDAFNIMYKQPRRKERDQLLLTQLLSTMKDGGDCMIVIDTAGRMLELAQLLDYLWPKQDVGLSTYNLVMLSSVASSVIEGAKSQIEWMADGIQKNFETARTNPFHLKNVKCCHSMTELNRVRSPKCVLVSGLEMESGFSRELFMDWCIDTRNMCIITGRSNENCLASKLIKMAETRESSHRPVSKTLNLEVKQRVKLDGAELNAYFEKKKAEHEEAKRQRQENKRRKERDEIMDESDSDDEDTAAAAARAVAEVSAKAAQEERIRLEREAKEQEKNGVVPVQPAFSVFPFVRKKLKLPHQLKLPFGDYLLYFHGPDRENYDLAAGPHTRYGAIKRKKVAFSFTVPKPVSWDDYGEAIDPEDYTIIEELKNVKGVKDNSDDSEDENEFPFALDDVPTKCIKKSVTVEVSCKVHFIDFEGRSDGESVIKLLEKLQPRKLVIVHASYRPTKHLADYCVEHKLVEDQVFAPYANECIDATVESRIVQVKLSEHLMKSVKFQKIQDTEVCWVDARLIKRNLFANGDENGTVAEEGEETVNGKQAEKEPAENAVEEVPENSETTEVMEVDEQNENGESAPKKRKRNPEDERVLVLESLAQTDQQPHRSLYIGDPKLSDVKSLLNSKGFHAEFHAGTLFVENVAAIQRATAGVFSIEGRTCMDFYRIRDLLKSQFAVI